jgi:SAM-dependent methyltransferase
MRWPIALLLTPVVLTLGAIPGFSQDPRFTNRLAPYVTSPTHVVDRMLELATLKPGETLFDLGSGDGRILIAAAEKYKAKAVGIEISPKLVDRANENILKEHLEASVRVVRGDVLEADLTGADVVTIFLATSLNEKLRPRLEKYLKPGARVVSYEYAVPGWKPAKVEQAGGRNPHLVYVYEIPPTKAN